MDYCILIELSRETIAFSYYTKDSGKFERYGDELVRPLAVWFNGNNIVLGSHAKHEAQRGTPNAFFNLFDVMGKQEYFEYSNEKHAYNKLILFAIRSGLREFFMDMMKSTYGTLDENIGKLPLLLILNPDVKNNERIVLINQLKDNGFGNIEELDEDKIILHVFFPKQEMDGKSILFLSSNGTDLFGRIMKDGHDASVFKMKDCGKDPRVDKLADLLWERSLAENDYLNKDEEIETLRNVANSFIQSGENSFGDRITFSDGVARYSYLDKSDLTVYTQHDGGFLTKEILSYLDNYGGSKNSFVVLKNMAATNKFLQEQLSMEFAQLLIVDRPVLDNVLNAIIEYGKRKGFVFSNLGSNTTSKVERSSQQGMISRVATREDRRKVREIEVALKHGADKDKAIKEAHDFLDEMHARNIHDFDEQLHVILDPLSTTDETPKHLVIEFNRTQRLINSYIRQGKTEEAKKEFEALSAKVGDYLKEELAELCRTLNETEGRQKESIPRKHVIEHSMNDKKNGAGKNKDKERTASLGDEKAKKGDFKAAREAYRQENNKRKGEECANVVVWQNRYLGFYEREIANGKTDKNELRQRITEVQHYLAIYKKYGADTSRLDLLLKKLKSIK